MKQASCKDVLAGGGIDQSVRCKPGHTKRNCCTPPETSSQSVFHRTKESGNFPKLRTNIFDVVIGRHSAEPVVNRLHMCKKRDRSGFFFGLGGFSAGMRARLIYIRLYSCSLIMVLRNFKSWWLPCHIETWLCAPTLKERLLCWKYSYVILGSGRGFSG